MTSAQASKKRERAEALISTGRANEAETILETLTSRDPLDDKAWHLLGNARYKQGKFQQAVTAYERRLALSPDSGIAHYSLALALRELGERDQAIALLNRALELSPDFPQARRHLAELRNSPSMRPGVIRGIARRVRLQREEDQWIARSTQQVLSFTVERTDDPRLPRVPVRMIGARIEGDIAEGDEVTFRVRRSASGVLVVSEVMNLETHAPVRVVGRQTRNVQRTILVVFLLLILGFFVFVGIQMANAPTGPPDWFPDF
jgi:lipopolysaccharide biosynthesis regulator YciM